MGLTKEFINYNLCTAPNVFRYFKLKRWRHKRADFYIYTLSSTMAAMTPSYTVIHHSHTNMLLFIQVSLCLPSRHSGLHLWTSSSLTSNCLIICSGLTSWTTGRSLIFAVRKQCLEGTTPCWIYWRQKTSASSSCTPYNWLINDMLSTLSKRTEVKKHTITS